MTDAVVAGAPVYYANETGIAPNFTGTNAVAKAKLSDVFFIETNVAGAQYIDPLFTFNEAAGTVTVSNRIYDRFSRQITKFLLQKVYYFDKHLSRFHTKIIGIAPIVSETDIPQPAFDDEDEPGSVSAQQLKGALRESILCWFLYDELKPHLAGQLIYQTSNTAQRMSYDEYFTKKMYADYLIGDNNLFRRLYSTTEDVSIPELKASVRKLAVELTEVESGIWSY